jgi:hypothetical protein
MKPLPILLLAASLFANVAFFTGTLQSPLSTAGAAAPTSGTTSIRAGTDPAKTIQTDPKEFTAILKAKNPDNMRDFLRAAGLPKTTVNVLVRQLIWENYDVRLKALSPKPDNSKPWWKGGNNDWYSITKEQRAELSTLEREAEAEETRVLGPDAHSCGFCQDPQLTFLGADKGKKVQKIEKDYEDLIREVQQEMQGIRLPSDDNKLKLLRNEKKRDLAAALTPQEQTEYDLRMSPNAKQLISQISQFDCTEEEYRKIFAIQKAYNDTQNLDAEGNPLNPGADDQAKRREDEKQLKELIKTALGTERFAEYKRSQSYEYQQLVAAGKRLALPPETARQVYSLRDTVASESARIVDNPDLGVDQKKQLLADLAKTTRSQVRARLGVEGTDSYLENGSMSWLNDVESGNAVSFDPVTDYITTRSP